MAKYRVLVDWQNLNNLSLSTFVFDYDTVSEASDKYNEKVGEISKHIAMCHGRNRCEIRMRDGEETLKKFVGESDR